MQGYSAGTALPLRHEFPIEASFSNGFSHFFKALRDTLLKWRRNMIRQLQRDERGSVIPMFAICLAAILAAVGGAVDYSRANASRTAMQAALDAAALMLAKEASGLTQAQLTQKAQSYFQINFNNSEAKSITVTPTFSNANGVNKIALQSTGSVDTTLFRVFGQMQIPISANSEVQWGTRRLEMALALDNTGSMAQSGKMAALQTATHSLIDTLKAASKKKDDIRIAIIPFTTFVNVDPKKNKNAKWIDFSDWSESTSVGLEAGLTTEWVNKKTGKKWSGCVADRTQPYDTQDTAPNGAADTMYPAVECVNPGPLQALTSNWNRLHKDADAMKPDGTTNVTIGLAWGWHALTSGAPLTEATAPAKDLDKVLVLLTDGENTENRWTTNTAAIDQRTRTVCENIKKEGIKLYTVRVIDGSASLLRGCATSPSMYFEVQQASQLNAVFKSIADSLATLRIAK
jgi:Flp pilus assembly protein TadG